MELRERLHQAFQCGSLIGTGPAHRRLLEQVRVAAASNAAVLIVGEPGTGKQLVARTIHHMGSTRHHPLLRIDCEALPATVLERELFASRLPPGHISEAASSLQQPSCGRLALAEGSSLLLGEILALPRDLQARLAQSLDGRVRLIATTAGDPDAALKQEKMQPELYYSLSVMVITTLPLRDAGTTCCCWPNTSWNGPTSAPARHAVASRPRPKWSFRLTIGPAISPSSAA